MGNLSRMSRNRILLIVGTVVAVIGLAAVALLVVAPAGAGSAEAAAIAHVEDRGDSGTSKLLTQRDWGDGQLVLVSYEKSGVKRLGLAFAAERFRGWRVDAYTEETVEPDDVRVGSLLIASSEGGSGQPPWSAAVGELIDDRIDRVEVTWAGQSEPAFAPIVNDAYLVVQRGTTEAVEARYLSEDGAEIAKVPVSSD
jgi:hypothetical protein